MRPLIDHDEGLRREALRVYRRYAAEIVEAFGLCPWAERARRQGRVREVVLVGAEPVTLAGDATEAVERIARDASVEVGLLILPRSPHDLLGHQRFVARLREAHAGRTPEGQPPLAMAAFHPEAKADTRDPARLVPFVRRTPDPTVQLVRLSVLDRVRGGTPGGTGFIDPETVDLRTLLEAPERAPLHERVAEANLRTIERVGVAHLSALLDAIRRDRDAAYARLEALPRQ